jgi:hypothetical protein
LLPAWPDATTASKPATTHPANVLLIQPLQRVSL